MLLARYLIIVSPLLLLQVIWILSPRDRARFVIQAILTLLLAYVIAKIGSHFYSNPRPFVIGDFEPLVPPGVENGFPSMHTLVASAIAFLAFTRNRIMGSMLFLIAIIVGIARMQAGVHHGIDVVGGIIFAVTAGMLARILLNIRVRR